MLIDTDYRALTTAGQDGLPLNMSGGVVVIGNFDGVHRGHQGLLAAAREQAKTLQCPVVALTFSPHPRQFFRPDEPPFLLMDRTQKYEALMAAGADAVVDIRFDAVLAGLTPAEFGHDILADALQAKHVMVGENFIFGKMRAGNLDTLKVLGTERGFGVTGLAQVVDGLQERFSSERARVAVRNGHVATAEDVLGRPWQMRGEVVHGEKLGRVLGFPTANMRMGSYVQPKFGVYVASVQIEGEKILREAVISIGRKPTVGIFDPLLEAYLLDFDGDLYGKTIRVNILDFIRPELKFGDLDGLKEQIHKDVTQARGSFALNPIA